MNSEERMRAFNGQYQSETGQQAIRASGSSVPEKEEMSGDWTAFRPRPTNARTETQSPTSAEEKLPFQEFQQILSFLCSIGVATTASCAFGLAGNNSIFGDDSPAALALLRKSTNLLAWSTACFIIALVFIVAPQLLYTELVIVEIIKRKRMDHWNHRVVRVAVGIFAWIPLLFQTGGMLLLSESLKLFGSRPALAARYGIVVGVFLVIIVTGIGVLFEAKGKDKVLRTFTAGYRRFCVVCQKSYGHKEKAEHKHNDDA